MQKEELESILLQDNKPFDSNNISDKLLCFIDNIITENYQKISDEVFGIYKKFQPMKQEAPDSMKTVLFTTIKNFASEEGNKKHYVSQLLLMRFLLVKSVIAANDFLEIAKSIYRINHEYDIKEFISIFEKKEENKLLAYIELSDFYKSTGDLKTAIKYYEKFIEIDKTKAVIYNITADLYAKAYPYTSYDRQIELYEQSYKIDPNNRLVLHGLAFNYEKAGNNEKAEQFYKQLLENNPTENDYYNYGAFLIHCGDFPNGHKYFTHRFKINDINLRYPIDDNGEKRWNFTDNIENKILLIHYEQGFGDTIMYSRFVPYMKQFTNKIIFVVQKELFDLIDRAKIFDDIKVVPDDKIPEYDYSISLLDCPFALKTEVDKIPFCEGYLSINHDQIKQYKEKYIINNENLKIGLSVSGASDANYNDRNIDIAKLNFLTEVKNTDIYSLQKEFNGNNANIIPLGQTFNNFTDTACAIKNMDLVISTDNVILNLAGALGKETIGLFNRETNYRWFKTTGDNVGWYKSVKPLQNKIQNDWTQALMELNNIIAKCKYL